MDILPPDSASQLEFKSGCPLEFCLKQSLLASALLMQKLSLAYLSIGLLLVGHKVLSGVEDIDFLTWAAKGKRLMVFKKWELLLQDYVRKSP